jgi:hypothetical protein
MAEIVSPPCHETTKKTKYGDNLIEKEDINVNTKSDMAKSFITGCAVLNMNELVLADTDNKKVKLVSIENKLVQKEKSLDTRPWDIAVISQDQFAVTMPGIKSIVVMTTDDKLSSVRSIKVGRECYGIDLNQDCFYVACLSPPSVIVLNTKGDILNDISLNFLTIGFAPYIAVRRDSKLMFISDSGHDSVMSVSLQEEVRVAYKHADLSGPCGLLMLDDRSLLVCCRCNDKIYQVKEDLKQVKIVHENIPDPYSICYNKHSGEVYVGCHGNQLKVLSKNDQ